MPPGRRGRPAGSTSASRNNNNPQQRLSFGPNATNKITKPSPLSRDAKKLSPSAKSALKKEVDSASASPAPEIPKQDEIELEEEEEEEQEQETKSKALPIRGNEREAEQSSSRDVESKRETKQKQRDSKEVEALKVSEAQIKKYWLLKEQDRIAPRVHQQGLSVHEKVLREFDLSSQFGPCIGIERSRRWKRADGLGLKPPLEVLAVLLKEEQGKGKGVEGLERAYVDTLMGGRSVGVEA